MIALKCPSCAANLSLDDSREFGFCQYCGTKIQLVQRVVHSGTVQVNTVQPERQKLEAAKTLMELGEYVKAHQILDELTRNYPQFGESWLYLAKLRYTVWQGNFVNKSLYGIVFESCTTVYGAKVVSAFDAWMRERNIKLNSPEHARDAVLRYLTETSEMTNARKLLGVGHPAYKAMLAEFTEWAKKDCRKTREQIDILNRDPMKLDGIGRFFKYGRQLMVHSYFADTEYGGYSGYYVVTIDGCDLEHEIAMLFSGGMAAYRHYTEHILYSDGQECWTDRNHYFRRSDSKHGDDLRRGFENVRNIRRKRHLCMMCGGPKGLLGCQNRCVSQMR